MQYIDQDWTFGDKKQPLHESRLTPGEIQRLDIRRYCEVTIIFHCVR